MFLFNGKVKKFNKQLNNQLIKTMLQKLDLFKLNGHKCDYLCMLTQRDFMSCCVFLKLKGTHLGCERWKRHALLLVFSALRGLVSSGF